MVPVKLHNFTNDHDFLWDTHQTYWLFLFSVLESFVRAQKADVVVCVENEHCQIECIGKPMCEPHDAVKWFQFYWEIWSFILTELNCFSLIIINRIWLIFSLNDFVSLNDKLKKIESRHSILVFINY